MRSFALIALLSFSAQVHAEQPAKTDMTDELTDKLVEKLVDKLLGKSLLTNKIPAPAMGSMQAYSPYNAKKYETLSYLPQISNDEIMKQITYMIRNNWTPALEFSDDGDVYLNTRMGPGYYDNSFKVRWEDFKEIP